LNRCWLPIFGDLVLEQPRIVRVSTINPLLASAKPGCWRWTQESFCTRRHYAVPKARPFAPYRTQYVEHKRRACGTVFLTFYFARSLPKMNR
jgi:hypothetical protein